MDKLYCMQVFVRVVEHGAFVRAAESLGISRASATAAVAELEKEFGVRLINRTTRRLNVTDEGQAYYQNCVRLLGEISEAEDSLTKSRLSPKGRLRVSVPHSFMNTTFYPALNEFLQRYPELDVEMAFTDRAVNLVEEGIDCAIRGLEIPPDADLVAIKLSDVSWLTCAAPAYLEDNGVPETVADLDKHNCIRFTSQSTGRPRHWQFIDDGAPVAIVPTGNLRLTSFDAAIRAARAGSGIAQVPDGLGLDAVRSGELVPILTKYVAAAPSLMLVYPGNRYLTAKVQAFKEFFMPHFPREGWWDEIVTYARERPLQAVAQKSQ